VEFVELETQLFHNNPLCGQNHILQVEKNAKKITGAQAFSSCPVASAS
jgi:hypothetical protein